MSNGNRMLRALTGALALVALPAVAGALEGSTDFDWKWTLGRGETLTIRGINGPIQVSATTGRETRVTAEKRAGSHCDADEVRIEVSRQKGGVMLCAIYPRRNGENECSPDEGNEWDNDRCDTSVGWTVELAAGVSFTGRTVNGDVRVDGADGPVEVSTVNGSIRVETRSWAIAETVNGSVTAVLGARRWTAPLGFSTVNGNVDVELPSGVSADVRGDVMNGRISSDFPVTISKRAGMRRVRGTLGQGGSPLEMATTNGNLKLRERAAGQ